MNQKAGMALQRDTVRLARTNATSPIPIRRIGALLAGLVAALAASSVHAQDASAPAAGGDEAFYHRAAVCAAAMEVDQLALADRARAGDATARAPLVELTKLGFSYVGEAYLHGLRNPRADEMLKAERVEVRAWEPARRVKTVGECRVEAQAIFDGANSFTQALLMNRVNKRVDKFLASPAPAASAASSSSASR